ncbi:MAG: hypothetical protein V1890_05535 [Candidatus Zixiibacteriota bacterium]
MSRIVVARFIERELVARPFQGRLGEAKSLALRNTEYDRKPIGLGTT